MPCGYLTGAVLAMVLRDCISTTATLCSPVADGYTLPKSEPPKHHERWESRRDLPQPPVSSCRKPRVDQRSCGRCREDRERRRDSDSRSEPLGLAAARPQPSSMVSTLSSRREPRLLCGRVSRAISQYVAHRRFRIGNLEINPSSPGRVLSHDRLGGYAPGTNGRPSKDGLSVHP